MSKQAYEIEFDEIPSPCYLLDERRLIKNLELLKDVQNQSGASILCALKGYAMHYTFPILKEYLHGGTASSLHEAKLIHEEWGNKAHVCAPVYLENEIKELSEISSHITFNSFSQYERFKDELKGISLGIRVNPEYSEVETEIYNPCSPKSRLGTRREDFPAEFPQEIEGLHFHSMCEQGADTLERTLVHIEQRFGDLLPQLKWINMGGGHHITRSNYDTELLIKLIKGIKTKYDIQVFLEPGEAIGWETGYLVSSVQDIVAHKGIKTAMLDVSFSAHMPDCLEMPYKPHVVGAIQPTPIFPTYQLGGNTCLAGDQLGDYSFINELKIGDRVVFYDMIHYTMVKNTTFNGVNLPSIAIYTKNDELKFIKDFGYDEYKRRLS